MEFDACSMGGAIGILPLMNHEEKVKSLGIELPPVPQAAGLYKPMLVVGDLAYLSGHLPILEDGTMRVGKVGKDCTVEEGSDAARQVGLNMLATLRDGPIPQSCQHIQTNLPCCITPLFHSAVLAYLTNPHGAILQNGEVPG